MKKIAAAVIAVGALTIGPAARAGMKTFDVTWSNDKAVPIGFAAVTLDTALITVEEPYVFHVIPIDQVRDLRLTIVGGPVGNVTYGKSAFNGISFTSSSPLDLNRELLGQPVTVHDLIGGMPVVYQAPFGVIDDGRTGSFNIFSYVDSTPHSVLPFQIASYADGVYSDTLYLSSILPRAGVVPEPHTWALLLAGLALMSAQGIKKPRRSGVSV
jgi:hypothetical protein